ncbi:HdeD family acid-resistance protein [Mycobacterium sp. OTB74]|jgi:uncharacterized membrane protein HdeD (DUF308 family)|uniref:HdeD family acid-resistance protein n=1 Tax=Mycobacterium sp. OTB74 TaxID=1853452 RepID=UPI002474280B|nr:HdeD family acid-resistance protein [Mycobacterium sp. OTB74]MDH6245790.1 uncharacterized membrane protein HdeD (DUF308 family) [Mycobacterium sp. OTB74]
MTENHHPVEGFIHRVWSSTVLFGVLAIILGVLILAWPGLSIVTAAAVFGVYLVVSGVVMIFAAFSLPASAGSKFLSVLSGAISIILGVLAFRHFGEGYAILLLAIWIGIGFIFRGVSAFAAALADKHFPGRGWAIFFGIISGIAGIVVLAYPFDSIATLALVTGVWLIVLGITEVIGGLSMRHDVKKLHGLVSTGEPAESK